MKRVKLKRQKQQYNKNAFFSSPGPNDVEVAFLPEWQFNFAARPVAKSDTIVIGEVLNGEAHRSHNMLNVFSDFEVIQAKENGSSPYTRMENKAAASTRMHRPTVFTAADMRVIET